MSAPDPLALGARAEAMIKELGAISAEPSGWCGCSSRPSTAAPPIGLHCGCATPA